MTGSFTDITEKKKTEEEIESFKRAIDNCSDAIGMATPEGKHWYQNKALTGLSGLSKGQIEGNAGPPSTVYDDENVGRKVFETIMAGKQWSGEVKMFGGRDIHLRAYSVKDKQGNVIDLVGIHTDISERKKAEKAVIQAERLSAIGELASGAAHDFNNSLQGIFGNIELALLEDSSPEVKGYLETIKKSASDAASRIQQLQRFAGKRTESLEYQLIDFNSVVDDAIAQTRNLWKDEAQKNGVNIAVNTNYGDDVSVLGNQGNIRSVLYNLIKNSVQAMPDGGTIDIATRREGEKGCLTLTDTGEGMDEETTKKIFEPFFTTKSLKQGSGLGMSGAYSTIQEHNGEIYVKKTEVGKGTTFEIVLPYAQIETAPEKDKHPEYEGIARVLWVDDEEMIRNLGKMQLERMGHKTDVASGGNEALELLASNEYDLMITDIGMPNMSGWQLAEQIKGQYSGMKVAVVSGWGNDVKPKQKKQYGVGYVLGKPYKMDQLKGLVGEVLQMKIK